MEGHWERVNTPLRTLTARERGAVVSGTVATAIALLVVLLLTAGDSQPAPAPGCIRASVAGRTGAELVQRCGGAAIATCRGALQFGGPAGEAILAACRDSRIHFASSAPGASGSG